jgi:hypothetical protein
MDGFQHGFLIRRRLHTEFKDSKVRSIVDAAINLLNIPRNVQMFKAYKNGLKLVIPNTVWAA